MMVKNDVTLLPQPPYRTVPESSQIIIRTQLAVLMLPATAAVLFFGYHALKLMMLAMLAAGLAESLSKKIIFTKMSGSMTHSLMMGLIVAFLLPPQARWYVAVTGALVAVVLAKHLLGGLGYYIWHPALAGRLAVQILFGGSENNPLSSNAGPLLARNHMTLGNINAVPAEPTDWLQVDWFSSSPPGNFDGWMLIRPEEVWRGFEIQLSQPDMVPQISQFMIGQLPTLEHCLIGAVPGALGQTCVLALILVGVFLVYRGYITWQLPLVFLGSAYLAAMLLPLAVTFEPGGAQKVFWPFLAENLAVGFTYVHYQLFSGGLFFGALVICSDMTSRPVTVIGQVFFGLGAGLLTMVFRFYSEITIPCISAILLMNSLVPLIDGLTCPKGPLNVKVKKALKTR